MKFMLKGRLLRFAGVFIVGSAFTVAGDGDVASGDPADWPMHHVDNVMWNHNSLSPADVDKDGHADYAVVHEGMDVVSIVFHPGHAAGLRKPWPKVVIGGGGNVEYAWLDDLDGDGNIDLISAIGYTKDNGPPTGVKVFWGPQPRHVYSSSAWRDAGYIPATKDRGHLLYLRTFDVNGDGAADIVAGGRTMGTHSLVGIEGKKTAGIIWIRAPRDKTQRRNLEKWEVYDIDPQTKGGHGFIFVDIDRDGDMDIADCNADWNTPDDEEAVLWYENPGTGSLEQRKPWRRHVIYQGGEFYSKAQTAAADMDGDGLMDVVVPTDKTIQWFRCTNHRPVTWQRIVIPKPKITQWLQRPIGLVDLNGDGKLDIVGMLIHDEKGNLPSDKAAVFWMQYDGDQPRSDNWKTHVIKRSDGVNTGLKYRGEKWDHARFVDLDGDGDIDILGNCEEHYRMPRHITTIGVVWFENRLHNR